MSEKPQPCRHKRPFCLECHGSEFQGGVSVKRTAIEYLKRNHPSACERAGLCETIGGRLYTVTLSCHGYVLAADYEALQAECEKLRNIISDLKDWDCDVSGGFLSIPVDLRRRMQEAIDAAIQEQTK